MVPSKFTEVVQFLEKDHGEARMYSPLDRHPLFGEFGLKRGDTIAEFPDYSRFILYEEGGFTPIRVGSL